VIRFFAKPDDISENTIKLGGDDCEHIRSLRLRPDELFVVCDGSGNDYLCRLSKPAGKKNVSGEKGVTGAAVAYIVSKNRSRAEPSVKCTLYIAYAKGERLDYAVQKSVELGAYEIVLYESERCVAVPNNIPKKIERLQRIALEAAKQSGRGKIPKVSDAGLFEKVITTVSAEYDLPLLCYEEETKLHIKAALDGAFPMSRNPEAKTAAIITGPEGGFTEREAETAKTHGVLTVSLGERILRSDTAPVAVLGAIMYHTGNL